MLSALGFLDSDLETPLRILRVDETVEPVLIIEDILLVSGDKYPAYKWRTTFSIGGRQILMRVAGDSVETQYTIGIPSSVSFV